MAKKVGGRCRTRQVFFAGDLDETHRACLAEQRHRVGERARRDPASVPCHRDPVEFRLPRLHFGKEQHRPAGFEHHAFGKIGALRMAVDRNHRKVVRSRLHGKLPVTDRGRAIDDEDAAVEIGRDDGGKFLR